MSMNSIWLPIATLLALGVCVPPVAGKEFSLEPGQTAIGSVGEYTTEDKDTLLDVARNNDVGYTELVVVNPGVNPWVPGQDKRIIVPDSTCCPTVRAAASSSISRNNACFIFHLAATELKPIPLVPVWRAG